MTWVSGWFGWCHEMPRRKRIVPEGLTLDLTEMPVGEVDIDLLLEREKQKAEEKQRIKEANAKEKQRVKEEKKQAKEEKKKAKEEQQKIKESPKQFDIDIYLDGMFNNKRKCNCCDAFILFGSICAGCCSKIKEENINNVIEYLETKGMIKCNFCGVCSRKDYTGFHFDHLNMFNKTNTIWSLVCSTTNLEEIYAEIDKCQLLCISCHKLVTQLEQRYGFTRLKIKYTKGDITRSHSELEEEYNKIMVPIYDKIRGRWSGILENFSSET